MQGFVKVSGKCEVCGKNKEGFVSIVLITGQTITMCMDCYADAMRKINEDTDTGARA